MGQLNVTVDSQPVQTTAVSSPLISGTYDFSIADVPGVVAANNFISVFNPIGSGKTMLFIGAFVSSTSAGGTTATAPMRGLRVTAASAGTLQAASATAKFKTSQPNPAVEVRIGNPTVTAGAPFFNSPPTISATNGSTSVHSITVPPTAAASTFDLVPGEGIVLQTASGDVDQRWNLSVVWSEF